MPLELLITNIFFVFSSLVGAGLGLFVFLKRPKKNGGTNIIFFITVATGSLWSVAYALGINLHDPNMSRIAFSVAVLVTLFLIILNIQLVLAISNRLQNQKRLLMFLHTVTVVIVIFYAFFPDSLLLPSAPQMYLPNFLVPGPLYSVQDIFFTLCLLYLLVQILLSYRYGSLMTKKRLRFFIIAFLIAYALAVLPEFLLYGINVDPLFTSLFGFYTIPMAYAILQQDMVDLNVLAKRALWYGLSIAGVALFILLTGYANNAITAIVPGFPPWILALISGMIAVAAGVYVWKKIKETETLKFEFIDVVTHKFRTPLTYIKWSLETLRSTASKPEDNARALDAIQDANLKLYELTDVLTGLSGSENNSYLYVPVESDISKQVEEAVAFAKERMREKNISIKHHIPDNLPRIFSDKQKTQFVIQNIIDNALTYSPAGGNITIQARRQKSNVILSIQDSGIGISKEDHPHIFSKFFRAANATAASTEGLGIGLYLSRDIMRRNGGDITVESAGSGTGSTFFIKIPIKK